MPEDFFNIFFSSDKAKNLFRDVSPIEYTENGLMDLMLPSWEYMQAKVYISLFSFPQNFSSNKKELLQKKLIPYKETIAIPNPSQDPKLLWSRYFNPFKTFQTV